MQKRIGVARIDELVSILVDEDRQRAELLIELIQSISDGKGDSVLHSRRNIALRKAWTITEDAEAQYQAYIGENTGRGVVVSSSFTKQTKRRQKAN